MQTREGAAAGHLIKGQQAVLGQGGGAGRLALVEMGIQSGIMVYGRAQQKGAVWVRIQRTQRFLCASCWLTGVRQVATTAGS